MPELADQIFQSVYRMRQFEGTMMKNYHSMYGTRYFEGIRFTKIKRILKISKFRLRTQLTFLAGQL